MIGHEIAERHVIPARLRSPPKGVVEMGMKKTVKASAKRINIGNKLSSEGSANSGTKEEGQICFLQLVDGGMREVLLSSKFPDPEVLDHAISRTIDPLS